MPTKNIILGAGPAGLFCAHELQQRGRPAILIEKNDYPGGLAATHEIDGAGFEVGPHIFQDNDEYIFQIAKEYLGEDLEYKNWRVPGIDIPTADRFAADSNLLYFYRP